jgi:uncharacterized protein (DUF58 family)
MELIPEDLRFTEMLDLFAKQTVEGFMVGQHKSPYHGYSVEFSEHRPFHTGESARYVDWKLYARSDKLFVKKFEEETNLRCQMVIDTSASMLFPAEGQGDLNSPNKLTYSAVAAAALMNLMRRQRDAVGLTFMDEQVRLHTQARTSGVHHRQLLRFLTTLVRKKPDHHHQTKVSEHLHALAEQLHRRSLVLFFTDWWETLNADPEVFTSALRHLRYNKHEVVVFLVFDGKLEQSLDLEDRPYRVTDLETGRTVDLEPGMIRERYTEAVRSRYEAIRRLCGQYGIDVFEADVTKGYHSVLLDFLRKRGKLF